MLSQSLLKSLDVSFLLNPDRHGDNLVISADLKTLTHQQPPSYRTCECFPEIPLAGTHLIQAKYIGDSFWKESIGIKLQRDDLDKDSWDGVYYCNDGEIMDRDQSLDTCPKFKSGDVVGVELN